MKTHECPGCLGEGEMDFSDTDVPMERLARVCGYEFEPLGLQPCSWCDGAGELSDSDYRDLRAQAIATFDQFQASVRDGVVKI